MLCQDCNEADATVVFTQMAGTEKQVSHLCRSCADKRSGSAASNAPAEGTSLLASWPAEEGDEEVVCTVCGQTLSEFKECGRFGCAGCYVAYGAKLERIMKRIHGSVRHRYEDPGSCNNPQEQVAALQASLDEAVASEAFEEAARLRDQISKMKP